MSRTLLIKFGAIGDVIMLLPAAYALHQSGHIIDWVCGPAVFPLLHLYPWINPILVDERAIVAGTTRQKIRAIYALWKAILPRLYVQIFTLYYDRRYRILAFPLRSSRKVLLSHTDRAFRLLPGRHHTDEYARILLGLPDEHRPMQLAPVRSPTLPESPLPPAAGTRIVLAPAGAKNLLADDVLRRYPAESYVELAELFLAQGHEVVLIGGPTDTWVQPLFAHLPVTNCIGRHRLPETLALLDTASLTITHDTGPLHLAGLTRSAILTLFGPTDPRGRLPQRRGTTAIWGGEGFACRPCYDGQAFAPCPQNDCIRQITPRMIFDEALRILQDPNQLPRILTPPHTLTQIS